MKGQNEKEFRARVCVVKGGEKIKKTRPDKQLLPPFLIDGYNPNNIKDIRSRYLKTKKLLEGNHFSMSIANRHFMLWGGFLCYYYYFFYFPTIADETTLEVSWKRV